jgi:hypothetical protein
MTQWKIGSSKSWPNEREKSEAQKQQRVAKKKRVQGGDATDDVSRITPSIRSSSALLISEC